VIVENVKPGDVSSLFVALFLVMWAAFTLGWFAERLWRVVRLALWLWWLELQALREARFFRGFARRQQARGGIRL
jgi:hypothetical protein